MSLTIDLSPEIETRLRQEAARNGQGMEEYARAVLEEKLAAALPAGRKPVWQQLVEIGDCLPEAERARLPVDSSENLEHYLYGLPKQSQ